jgi:hypothetical protein
MLQFQVAVCVRDMREVTRNGQQTNCKTLFYGFEKMRWQGGRADCWDC